MSIGVHGDVFKGEDRASGKAQDWREKEKGIQQRQSGHVHMGVRENSGPCPLPVT